MHRLQAAFFARQGQGRETSVGIGARSWSLRLAMAPFLAAFGWLTDAGKKAGMAGLEAHSTGANGGRHRCFS